MLVRHELEHKSRERRLCVGVSGLNLVCPGILDLVETGDTLEIDSESFLVRNVRSGKTLQAQPLPEIYRAMIEAGGEKPYLKARLAKAGQEHA